MTTQSQTPEMLAALEKVRKLLRLAKSSNANEAALAAARAQELIDRHRLTQAVMDLDAPDGSASDRLQEFADEPLDRPVRLDRWRGSLAFVLARANGCVVYRRGPWMFLIGRAADAAAVRYLYAWLSKETQRLVDVWGAGRGRVWRLNFRMGVVDAIAAALAARRAALACTVRAEAAAEGGGALVQVGAALARMDARYSEAEHWAAEHARLAAARRPSPMEADVNARRLGQRAGRTIDLAASRDGLSAPTGALGQAPLAGAHS